jgi:hypothetical protein
LPSFVYETYEQSPPREDPRVRYSPVKSDLGIKQRGRVDDRLEVDLQNNGTIFSGRDEKSIILNKKEVQ